ncbi:MAG: ferrous iron transport protein B [Bacteroidia bacterium]|nr:ferrous iron transport protein B [Bacteroidia bacterium]
MSNKTLKVALIGNPNSGKSTIFNLLTGLHQKVANFPGVTVEKKTGTFSLKNTEGAVLQIALTDLPGTYSLYPKALDERVTFQVLCDKMHSNYPDVAVVVADGTNLKRALFLCSQVVDLSIPVLLVINMIDLVNAAQTTIDTKAISDVFGIDVICMDARNNDGIPALKKALANYPTKAGKTIFNQQLFMPELNEALAKRYQLSSDYASFLIANNYKYISVFKEENEAGFMKDLLLQYNFEQSLQGNETLERYKFISSYMPSFVHNQALENKKSYSYKIDKILTHKIGGYAIFLFVLFILFQTIFTLAQYPMDFFDNWFSAFSIWVADNLPAGLLNNLLVDGVLAGLGGILIFIPQIALLFAFIALLEDSGYMARVSFIMDKLMRGIGLNGRSVIPLIGGVACAVPAIMGTRTIQNWRERMVTIFVLPLISCSARLPVYALLIALVIPPVKWFGFFNLQGLVLLVMYLIGFAAVVISALVIKLFIKDKQPSYFIMELPVYRVPQWSNVLYMVWDKVKVFVFDAGKIIIAISIILWVLSSFGPSLKMENIDKQFALQLAQPQADTAAVTNTMHAHKLEHSYAGIMGKKLEPLIAPLGFDWKIGIALITSFAAREVFVGTMSTIYSVGTDNMLSVKAKMQAEKNRHTQQPFYNMAVGVSLMLFYVFAMQCMSTLAIVKRETGSWLLPVLQFVYMGLLAYGSSFIAYQWLS